MKIVSYILFPLICTHNIYAQEYKQKEIDILAFIEKNFPTQETEASDRESISYERLYETFFQLYSNPLNLNTASEEQLLSLYVLSHPQVQSFLHYRETNGMLISIYELQGIPEFDVETISKLIPFVEVNTQESQKISPLHIIKNSQNYLLIRGSYPLQLKKGYTIENGYKGNPYQHHMRFRSTFGNAYSFGFTMETDAGESLWNNSQNIYGSDFYSTHLLLKNKGKWKALAIGDFQIQMGEGLVFGAGFKIGKGAETVLTLKKYNIGILPYTSVIETGFFRGAAASYSHKNINILAFYSFLPQDGSFASDSLNNESYVSSIITSGLHRTTKELENRNSIQEQNIGTSIWWKKKNLYAGINSIYTLYDTEIKKSDKQYNQYEFAGKQNTVSSFFFALQIKNIQLFGESAVSQSGGVGALVGMLISIHSSFLVSILSRSYDKNFHSFYSRAFGENTRNINEQGIYWGIKWKLHNKWLLTGYYDFFSFPWIRYNADKPTNGNEYLLRLTYTPHKKTTLFFQARSKEQIINYLEEEKKTNALTSSIKRNFIVDLHHKSTVLLSFKTRIQWSNYDLLGNTTYGYIIAQDVSFHTKKIDIALRSAFFDVDDFQNRQYIYEKDVLFAFSFPSYTNTGVIMYILSQIPLSKKISLSIRYSIMQILNVQTLFSGLEEIDGDTYSHARFQIKWNL